MAKRSAVVVGSGPNGLAAAIELARAGLSVEVREAAATPGGGARSAEWTLPGFVHDCCSAVHPLGVGSPFFSKLNLEQYGLKWIWSPAEVAHPLDDGTAVMLYRDFAKTAESLGQDGKAWRETFAPFALRWGSFANSILDPLRVPRHPLLLARFGLLALQPATVLARTLFKGERTRAVFGGLAAHAIKKLDSPLTGAIGSMFAASVHSVGWPIPEGGSQNLTRALIRVLESYGGKVTVNSRVNHLDEINGADIVMLDLTPRQLLPMLEGHLDKPFRKLLMQYKYGPGVFKVDWALREPIPWRAKECSLALTVHLGGTLEHMQASEADAWDGRPPSRPFVLLAQQSLFDSTRAPTGQHTVWAYCHVPHAWTGSALQQIEDQVERFAPGFRDCILARAMHGALDMQRLNENLIGGDINGGALTVWQFAFRPTWRQYSTPLRGVYVCSSATLPGGGVHGMCGYNAARVALRRMKN